MARIALLDTTLRDAHQCLWATRMTTAMMLPVARALDAAGFVAIDLMSGVQFDAAVRFLKEDPWERIRVLRARIERTPLQANLRSRSLLSFDVMPDDVNALWIERLVANGIRRIRSFDALNDMDNIVPSLAHARALGAQAVGAIVYSVSPIHDDALYVARVREMLARLPVDAVMLKDPSGLLTPERVRTLVPALKQVCGAVPLEVHSHCQTGLAPLVYLESARLGADILHTSIAPLAHGAAQPPAQTIARNLRAQGVEPGVDDAAIAAISTHFARVAAQEGKPAGVPAEYDEFHYRHQIPGGMISNMRAQLAQAGLGERIDAVLAECGRIREELGWPVMVTPFSQLVGTQAVLNVVQGERYRTVPDELKKYALGYYGRLPAPVDAQVLDRVVANGSARIALTPSAPAPGVPGLRARFPGMDDDERLLRYMYAGSQVDDMLAARVPAADYRFIQPLERLLAALARLPRQVRISVEKGPLRLSVSAGTASATPMEM